MLKKRKIPIKQLAIYVLCMAIVMVLIPLAITRLFPSLTPQKSQTPYNITLPETVDVYITKEKKTETINFETYIQGVVASEMPSTFDMEALKAQAVASRTYALGRINSGAKLCDTVHCQVYRSENISKKTKRAVNATAGQILLYKGKPVTQALYFASSAGDTENAEDVFSNPYPYLVSVSSSIEPGATHKNETTTMSVKKFSRVIKKAIPELDFGTIKSSNIRILSHTDGGRVKTIQVGNQTLSGSDIRNALSLYSTRFKISFTGKNIVISSSGSGHGVGMSQYGANGLAKEGQSYTQILSHYYQGTTVSKKQ